MPQGILKGNHSCKDSPRDTSSHSGLRLNSKGKEGDSKVPFQSGLLQPELLCSEPPDDFRDNYLVPGKGDGGGILPPSSLWSWPLDPCPQLQNQGEGRTPLCSF